MLGRGGGVKQEKEKETPHGHRQQCGNCRGEGRGGGERGYGVISGH